MIYCKRCLYPANHPYGILFDEEGVCTGCRVHEEKDSLNWNERFRTLEQIVSINKNITKGRGFDCIVPVTGGGDSYFIVDMVKNKLGLNPLLVHYNHQYNTNSGIRNLANLVSVFDCDIVTSTLSPSFIKKLTRHTLKKHGSMYWHVMAGFYTYPVQIAVRYRIPFIIWGVHPWSDQNGMYSHLDEVEMTERCRKEHGLMGISAEDLVSKKYSISRKDMQPFIYPYDNELERVGVRGLYLSNYIRWDSKKQHEEMIDKYGYESKSQQRTFNTYEDVHCAHSAGIHDYIKYLRLGFSKVTDHASREIRLKRMTREEGIKMVNKYTHVIPDDLDIFLNWVGMSEEEFLSNIDKRRDRKIWSKQNDTWTLKDSIDNHIDDQGVEEVRLKVTEKCKFLKTPSAEKDTKQDEYLLMGRCYVDKLNYGALNDRPVGGLTKRSWIRDSIKN